MINFTIVPDGGTSYDVVATTRDIVRWEGAGTNRAFSQLADTAKLTDMYELAYFAATRGGNFTGTLAQFKETVDMTFESGEEDFTHEGH